MTNSNAGTATSLLVAPKSSRKRRRRGVAAVELAIVAPLFLLLLAGIIEFGQVFRVQHMLSTASRHGARLAIVGSTSNTAQVKLKVKAICMKTLGVEEDDVTVEVSVNGNSNAELITAEKGDEIRVDVTIAFSDAGVGFFNFLFSESDLSASCIFERE